jgi:hypothetical protein
MPSQEVLHSTMRPSDTKCPPFNRGFAMPHVPWYRRKDYRRIRSIMDDGDKILGVHRRRNDDLREMLRALTLYP